MKLKKIITLIASTFIITSIGSGANFTGNQSIKAQADSNLKLKKNYWPKVLLNNAGAVSQKIQSDKTDTAYTRNVVGFDGDKLALYIYYPYYTKDNKALKKMKMHYLKLNYVKLINDTTFYISNNENGDYKGKNHIGFYLKVDISKNILYMKALGVGGNNGFNTDSTVKYKLYPTINKLDKAAGFKL